MYVFTYRFVQLPVRDTPWDGNCLGLRGGTCRMHDSHGMYVRNLKAVFRSDVFPYRFVLKMLLQEEMNFGVYSKVWDRTKRNETTKRNKTKRSDTKRSLTKPNQTEQHSITKHNATKKNETKRNSKSEQSSTTCFRLGHARNVYFTSSGKPLEAQPRPWW